MIRCFVVLSLFLVSSVWLAASGSYVPRPPRKLVKAERSAAEIDPERYGLGRALVLRTGEIRISNEVNASVRADQEAALRAVEARLSNEVRQKAQLTSLAGRLTPPQLDAVIYYLGVRFPAP
ncbi:MAG: hypothetical protein JNJ82_05235 [Opitutaceae bacterium]|nr:hypothetical protein [Opitutaceae bacterium]